MQPIDSDSLEPPRIVLEVKPSRPTPDIPTTLPYQIFFTLRRLPDSREEPCIIKWDVFREAFYRSRLVLLHQTDGHCERVDTEPPSPSSDSPGVAGEPIQVTTNNQVRHHLHELRPSCSAVFFLSLPEHYQRRLVPGQSYHLSWPGGEIDYWSWGSLAEKKGTFLEQRPSAKIVLPASEGFSFTATEELERWPGRADAEAKLGYSRANTMEYQWRADEANRRRAAAGADDSSLAYQARSDPGVPVLKTTLEAPAELSLDKPFKVTARVTLQNDGPDARPATFHTYRVDQGYEVFRRRRSEAQKAGDEGSNDGESWEPCPRDETTGFLIVDDPDVRVNVAQHEDFVSLQPGEDWSDQYTFHHPAGGDLPADAAAGDRFRVRFTGVELDWWDWGSAEEHAGTEVSLPCFIKGDVTEPKDNAGRPKCRLAVSNDVEFTVKA